MRSNRIFISVLLVFLFFIPTTVISQINYGTTGLMNMPTADMQTVSYKYLTLTTYDLV